MKFMKILKCAGCGAYTMMRKHCGVASKTVHPPKFSVEDRWAKYRRAERFGKRGGGKEAKE